MTSPERSSRNGSGSRALLTLPVALVILAAGCDLPTETPWWDTRWKIPGEDARVGSEAFLPDGVTLSGDGTVFLVDVANATDFRTLGELCPLCVPLDGQTAPKPAFEGTMDFLGPLPEDLEEALVEDGVLVLQFEHEFSFDPIRPGDTPGSMEIQVWDGSNGGRLLADSVISGAVDTFPPGVTKRVGLELEPGIIQDGLFVEIRLDSPEGDPTEIQADDRLDGWFRPEPLRVTGARVQAAGREVHLDTTELDVEDLDEGLVERVMEGGADILIQNPFDVTVDMDLRISGPESPDVTRALIIAPGTNSARLDFSGEELRSFLGRPGVILEGVGTVREDADPVDLTPQDEVTLRVTLDLTVRMGAEP